MCGRLNIHDSAAVQRLMEQLGLPLYPQRPPRYNITPGSPLDVVFDHDHMAAMDWGIEFGKFRHPNTKTETLKRKPYLQKLLMENRCIVPVNRFYEWPDAKLRPAWQGKKNRFCIHPPNDVMFLGGIYKINPDGIMQFNVLTTDPNDAINVFHHRMPVVIAADQVRAWLDSDDKSFLFSLMVPYRKDLIVYACDAYVDNGRHEGEQCMQPQSAQS